MASVGLFGLSALAIDVSYWRYEQRVQQSAADSAAMAGAIQEFYTPGSSGLTSVTAAARSASAANGFTHDGVKTFVTVNVPPQSGSYTSSSQAVEVIVRKAQPAFFGGIFGRASQNVTARAVAMPSNANAECIYALDTVGPSITINGAVLSMKSCGIISNGKLLFNQGSVDAAFIGVGTALSNDTVNGTAFPHAQPMQAVPAVDPCPTVPACAYLTANPPTSGSCATQTTFNGPTIVLSPARYCNQVLLNNPTTVTFNQGVYDFENGMTLNGGGTPTFNGSNVTFYIKGNNWILNGSPTVNLSAPTSGNTAGVLIYQPVANTTQFHINSGSSPGTGVYNGMLYFPGTTMIIDGKYVQWSLAVAKDILFNQGGITSQSTATIFARAALGE